MIIWQFKLTSYNLFINFPKSTTVAQKNQQTQSNSNFNISQHNHTPFSFLIFYNNHKYDLIVKIATFAAITVRKRKYRDAINQNTVI